MPTTPQARPPTRTGIEIVPHHLLRIRATLTPSGPTQKVVQTQGEHCMVVRLYRSIVHPSRRNKNMLAHTRHNIHDGRLKQSAGISFSIWDMCGWLRLPSRAIGNGCKTGLQNSRHIDFWKWNSTSKILDLRQHKIFWHL